MRSNFTLAALKAAQKPFFKAALQNDGTLEFLVYEEIGEDWWSGGGITAKTFKQQIDAASNISAFFVRINSPGGDPFEGSAIYNLLRAEAKQRGIAVTVAVDGVAASAASIIAMAGDTITMGPNAMMMIHNAWGYCQGFASDMRQTADALDAISSAIAQTYVTRTKKSLADITAMMNAQTWMTAQQCLENGFCTAIVEEPEIEQSALAMARKFEGLAHLKQVPDALKAQAEPEPAAARRSTITIELSPEFKAHLDKVIEQMTALNAARNSATPATQPPPANAGTADCACDCENCMADDCDNCTNEDCEDPNCEECPQQTETNKANKAAKKAQAADDLDRAKAQLQLGKMKSGSR